MTRPSTLRSSVVAAIAAAVLLLSACGTSDGTVLAVVNGVEVTQEEVTDLRPDDGDPTVPGEQLRQDLSLLVFQQAMLDRLEEEFGIRPSQGDVDRFLAEPPTEEQAQAIEALRGDGRFTEEVVRRQAMFFVIGREARRELAGEEGTVTRLLEESPAQFTSVCALHILVGSAEEALDAVERMEAGESFGDLADELSLDEQAPQGDLGCRPAGEYVDEFAEAAITAPVGQLVGPVQTQFGFHLIVVESRDPLPSVAEVMDDPLTYVPADIVETLYGTWLSDAIRAADIDVNSRVGTWNPTALAIAPPDA